MQRVVGLFLACFIIFSCQSVHAASCSPAQLCTSMEQYWLCSNGVAGKGEMPSDVSDMPLAKGINFPYEADENLPGRGRIKSMCHYMGWGHSKHGADHIWLWQCVDGSKGYGYDKTLVEALLKHKEKELKTKLLKKDDVKWQLISEGQTLEKALQDARIHVTRSDSVFKQGGSIKKAVSSSGADLFAPLNGQTKPTKQVPPSSCVKVGKDKFWFCSNGHYDLGVMPDDASNRPPARPEYSDYKKSLYSVSRGGPCQGKGWRYASGEKWFWLCEGGERGVVSSMDELVKILEDRRDKARIQKRSATKVKKSSGAPTVEDLARVKKYQGTCGDLPMHLGKCSRFSCEQPHMMDPNGKVTHQVVGKLEDGRCHYVTRQQPGATINCAYAADDLTVAEAAMKQMLSGTFSAGFKAGLNNVEIKGQDAVAHYSRIQNDKCQMMP